MTKELKSINQKAKTADNLSRGVHRLLNKVIRGVIGVSFLLFVGLYHNCGGKNSPLDFGKPEQIITNYTTTVGNPLSNLKFSQRGFALGTQIVAEGLCTLVNKCYPNVKIQSCYSELQNQVATEMVFNIESIARPELRFSELEDLEIKDKYMANYQAASAIKRKLKSENCNSSAVLNYSNTGLRDLIANYTNWFLVPIEDLPSTEIHKWLVSQWLKDGGAGHGRVAKLLSIIPVEENSAAPTRLTYSKEITVREGFNYEFSAVVAVDAPDTSVKLSIALYGDSKLIPISINFRETFNPSDGWRDIKVKYMVPKGLNAQTLSITPSFEIFGKGSYLIDDVKMIETETGRNLIENSGFESNPYDNFFTGV